MIDFVLDPDLQIGDGRVAAIVDYDGSTYHGWQLQKTGVSSIQQTLETALSKVANHPVETVCAGRTDAGVHATAQVVHFDTSSIRSFRSWLLGVNTLLPRNVSLQWIGNVDADFNARFSATARRYHYFIYNHALRSSFTSDQVTWCHQELDASVMHEAAQVLIGENDFTSYRAVGCQSKTPFRNIHFITVERRGRLIVIDIQANAFLHHMVRNITGVLMAIGSGKQKADWAGEVLHAKDRRLGGVTAPPNGLYLVDVRYPEKWNMPSLDIGPFFWQKD